MRRQKWPCDNGSFLFVIIFTMTPDGNALPTLGVRISIPEKPNTSERKTWTRSPSGLLGEMMKEVNYTSVICFLYKIHLSSWYCCCGNGHMSFGRKAWRVSIFNTCVGITVLFLQGVSSFASINELCLWESGSEWQFFMTGTDISLLFASSWFSKYRSSKTPVNNPYILSQ